MGEWSSPARFAAKNSNGRTAILTLALCVTLITDSARSQRRVQPQNPGQSSEKAATADQRGTEKSPLIVKVLPSPNDPKETDRSAKKEEDKADSDRWLVILTGALALAGFLQLLVFGWQGIQLKRIVDLGREEFISTHRPRIRVRRIVLDGAHGSLGAEWLSHGDEFEIAITLANVGGTACTIVDGHYEIRFSKIDDSSIGTNRSIRPLLAEQITVPAGQQYVVRLNEIASLKYPGEEMRVMHQFKQEGWKMLIVGDVIYRDGLKHNRVTGFTRECSAEGRRFRRIDDPDYEYED